MGRQIPATHQQNESSAAAAIVERRGEIIEFATAKGAGCENVL